MDFLEELKKKIDLTDEEDNLINENQMMIYLNMKEISHYTNQKYQKRKRKLKRLKKKFK